mgnify:CR=1 FL=1
MTDRGRDITDCGCNQWQIEVDLHWLWVLSMTDRGRDITDCECNQWHIEVDISLIVGVINDR